jgi:hypothetical protein
VILALPCSPDVPIEGAPDPNENRHDLVVDQGHAMLYELFRGSPERVARVELPVPGKCSICDGTGGGPELDLCGRRQTIGVSESYTV